MTCSKEKPMAEIQRYVCTADDDGKPLMVAQEHARWMIDDDVTAALEAQAEEHRKELKSELTRIALQQEEYWSEQCARIRREHATELAALRGVGELALVTLTWEDIHALREGCEPVRIHRDFKPSFLRLCDIADHWGVEIWPTHSVRYLDQEMLDLVMKKAKRSNHLAGSAVDMNPVYQGIWYTSEMMKDFRSLPEPVRLFLNSVIADPDLRWGGAFGVNKDRVHFDSNLALRDPAEWQRRVGELRGERV